MSLNQKITLTVKSGVHGLRGIGTSYENLTKKPRKMENCLEGWFGSNMQTGMRYTKSLKYKKIKFVFFMSQDLGMIGIIREWQMAIFTTVNLQKSRSGTEMSFGLQYFM